MMLLPLAKVPLIMNILAVIWVLVALILILLVLIQKGKGGGLGAAFGGGAQTLLGTKTGDFFTWVTIVMVVLFLGLAVVLVKFYRPSGPSGLDMSIETTPAQTAAVETETAQDAEAVLDSQSETDSAEMPENEGE